MPRNPTTGAYEAPENSWNPAVAGTVIDPEDWNATQSDYVAALNDIPGAAVEVPFSVGEGVTPVVENSISSTGTFTNGSPAFTVADATGIEPGMAVIATHADSNAIVSTVVGTTVTMNLDAIGDGATAVRFGNNRWDEDSTLIVNTIGAENIYVGDSADGNTSWVWEYHSGLDYKEITSVQISNPTGGLGLQVSGRTSTTPDSFPDIISAGFLAVVDDNENKDAWAQYIQTTTVPASSGSALGVENSFENYWPETPIDPYNVNPQYRAVNMRLDSGIGPFGPFHAQGLTPTNCSAAIDIIDNGAKYLSGVVFGSDALDTDSGPAPMIAAAPNHSVTWYYGASNVAWRLYSNASAAGGNIVLGNANINYLASDGTTSYHFMSLSGAGVSTFGPSTGDQVLITGGTAGTGFVSIEAVSTPDANVSLVLDAQGTGIIRAAAQLEVPAGSTSAAGLNIPQGVAPTSPVNGDVWTTTAGMFVRANGVTQQLAPLASPAFTGNPTAPTQTALDNSTKLASTAYVDRVVPQAAFTAYTPALVWTGGTPTAPTVSARYQRNGKMLTISILLYSGSALNGATGVTIALPAATTAFGDNIIPAMDIGTGGPVFGVVAPSGAVITGNFASGGGLQVNHYYQFNGSFEVN